MRSKIYFLFIIFFLVSSYSSYSLAGSAISGADPNNRQPPYVQDEVIIGFRQNVSQSEKERLFSPLGKIVPHKWRSNIFHLKIKNGSSVENTIRDLKINPSIKFAQPNYAHHLLACALPNASTDEYFTGATISQACFTLTNPKWPYTNINAELAWNQLPSTWPCPFDTPVTVAILDSGCSSSNINANHPDLPSSIFATGYNFSNNSTDTTDDDGHGTFIAGIIAAQWSNSSPINVCTNNAPSNFNGGMAGMAGYPGLVKIMPIKIFSNVNGIEQTTTSQEIDGINFALDYGVKVLNMSIGGTTFDTAEYTAINDAIGQGCIVVAAAGDANNNTPVEYPAAYSGVIGVGATDIQNNLASYSNTGSGLWLVAPGGGSTSSGGSIFSTMMNCPTTSIDPGLSFYPCDNNYGFGAGSSFAVPFVSGTIALMLAVKPSLTNSAVAQILAQTSSNNGIWQPSTGYGLLNASAAVNGAINYVPPTATPTSANLTWTPTPTTGSGGQGLGSSVTPTSTFTYTPTFTLTPTPTPTVTPTITLGYCVSWPGQQWTPVATGTPFIIGTSSVYNCTVYDSGTGPKLWLVGAAPPPSSSSGVWSSPNGTNWTLMSTPTFLNQRSSENISFNGKLLAMGGVYAPGPSAGPIGDIWTTSNGVDWTQAVTQAAFGARYGFSMVVFQGKLWVIGGLASMTGDMNDVWNSTDGINFNQVTTSGSIFSPRDGHTSVVFNNQIWVIGGRNQLQNTYFNDVWSSSDGVNWNQVTVNGSIFSPRCYQGNVVCGNAMWIVGGGNNTNSFNDVWVSEDGSTWTQTNSTMPFNPISLFNFNNEVWGLSGSPSVSPWLWRSPCCSVQLLTPTFTPTNTMTPTVTPTITLTPTVTVGLCPAGIPNISWSTNEKNGGGLGLVFAPNGQIPQMWNVSFHSGVNSVSYSVDGVNWTIKSNPSFLYNRCCEGALAFNGNMWLLGGYGPVTINGTVTNRKLADVWDSPDGANWNQVTSSAGFGALTDFGTAVFNGNIYVIGGQTGSGTTNAVCWSGDGNSWGSTGAPFSSRMDPSVAVFNGQLWVIGGMNYSENTAYNDVWVSSNGTSWSQVTVSGPIFSPRSGAGLVVTGNVMWLLGGRGPGYSNASYYTDEWYTLDGIHWFQSGNTSGSNNYGAFLYTNKIWTGDGDGNVCFVATPTPTFTVTPTLTNTPTLSPTFTNTPTLTNTLTCTPTITISPTINPTFGVSWAQGTGNAAFAQRWGQTSVVFDNGTGPKIYVMAGQNSNTNFSDVYSSPDGIVWTNLTSTAPFSGSNLCSAVYNGQIWVIGSNVYSSTDGTNWVAVCSSPSTFGNAYQNLTVFNDGTGDKLWMSGAVSLTTPPYGRVDQVDWYSTDGATWNEASTIISNNSPRTGYGWLSYGGNLWMIAGSKAGSNGYLNDVLSSPDGKTWTNIGNRNFPARGFFGATVANGRMWIAGGITAGNHSSQDVNDVWYSTDGKGWTQATASASFSPRDSFSGLAFREKMWSIAGKFVPTQNPTPTPFNDSWYSPSSPGLGTATYTSTPTNTPTPGGGIRKPLVVQESENPNVKTITPTLTPTFTPSSTSTLVPETVLVVAAPNISRNGQPIQFRVNLEQEAQIHLTLYSLTGEKVYQTTFSGQTGDNNLKWGLLNDFGASVASGLYVYTVELEDGWTLERRTGKVVVIK